VKKSEKNKGNKCMNLSEDYEWMPGLEGNRTKFVEWIFTQMYFHSNNNYK
jgi:hypothetical protein